MAANNILLQGDRHTGKTYLIGRIIDRYENSRLAGFFTWKNEDGIVYFRAWDNTEAIKHSIAQIIYREDDQIIRYKIFEDLGVRSITHAIQQADLMIFDELGRFEQDCELFTNAIRKALDCKAPVLAALKSVANPFLDSLRKRKDSFIHTITKNNREDLFSSVVRTLDPFLLVR